MKNGEAYLFSHISQSNLTDTLYVVEKPLLFSTGKDSERDLAGYEGFSDIRFEAKPLAMFEGGLFEYCKKTKHVSKIDVV